MSPVCGSDGHTYDSQCHLLRYSCLTSANVSKLNDGFCSQSSQSPVTSRDSGKSCGQESCPFGGTCVASASKAIACKCDQCLSEPLSPVCSNIGVTFKSECEMRRHACEHRTHLHITHTGHCRGCESINCSHYGRCELNEYGQAECHCPKVCIRVESPVCGSDGQTFENECELKVKACKLQVLIKVVSLGPCGECVQLVTSLFFLALCLSA